jgi:SAM-dependent methyltransferase
MIDAKGILDDFYSNFYEKLHGSGLLGRGGQTMHSSLEKGRGGQDSYRHTLELGSGNLEHFPHVKHKWSSYTAVDIRKPGESTKHNAFWGSAGTKFVQADACELPFDNGVFDRIVATCLLLHIEDVPQALKEWQRVRKECGVIDLLVPCETGMLLRLVRGLISKPKALRNGLPKKKWELINALDHVNSFPRVRALVEPCLDKDLTLKVKFFPFPFLRTHDLNLFAIFSIEPRSK